MGERVETACKEIVLSAALAAEVVLGMVAVALLVVAVDIPAVVQEMSALLVAVEDPITAEITSLISRVSIMVLDML